MHDGSVTDVFEHFLQFVRKNESIGGFTEQEVEHLFALVLMVRLFIDYHQTLQELASLRRKQQ